MARYLALDVIEPGDIVLTAELTKPSLAIRLASGSRVSHAALALHPLIWFEAVDSGVGYRLIRPELVGDGKRIRLGLKIGRGETYIVKRMKDAPYRTEDPMATHAFARSLMQATSQYAFLNYAKADQFLPLVKFGLGRTKFAQFVANNLDRSRTRLHPGPFCSWLVADCCRTVRRPLFEIASNKISPRALDKSRKLREVESEINAKPLGVPARFKAFERELHHVVEFGALPLSQVSGGASFVKTVREINTNMRAFGERATVLFGAETLKEERDALGKLDTEWKRKLEDWQEGALRAVTLAYRNVSTRSEIVRHLAECQEACIDPGPGGLACPSECYRIVKACNETHEVLDAAFPEIAQEILDLIDEPSGARAATPASAKPSS